MQPIPLDLPPGIVSDGTPYYRRGNWVDGSRVRWKEGVVMPIGGWARFGTNLGSLDRVITDPTTEVARAALGYTLNDGSAMFVVGTNKGLKAWYRGSTAISDITPADFVARPHEAEDATGYGMWFFGVDAYGTERQGDDLDRPDVFAWAFRNWGQNLLAAPKGKPSKLYEWVPTFGTPAAIVANTPTDFDCFHVTDQRIVMCAGTGAEPRLVQWSTRENNTEWAPTPENQAGSYTLPGTGRFKDIVSINGRYLLVSEADAYVCEYSGPPYIYGFEQAGEDCGTVSGLSIVAVGPRAMWLGEQSFYIFDGNAVAPLDCPVIERGLNDVNRSQVSKTVGFANPLWPEIWWLYQSGEEDLDSYVYYNWEVGYWAVGKLARTCAGGGASVGGLFMLGADGYAYNHELEGVAPIENDMSEVFVVSAPIEIAVNASAYVHGFIGDYKKDGEVNIFIEGQDHPNGPKIPFGPYTVKYPQAGGQPTPMRARGQLLTLRVEGKSALWSQGSIKLQIADMGASR